MSNGIRKLKKKCHFLSLPSSTPPARPDDENTDSWSRKPFLKLNAMWLCSVVFTPKLNASRPESCHTTKNHKRLGLTQHGRNGAQTVGVFITFIPSRTLFSWMHAFGIMITAGSPCSAGSTANLIFFGCYEDCFHDIYWVADLVKYVLVKMFKRILYSMLHYCWIMIL